MPVFRTGVFLIYRPNSPLSSILREKEFPIHRKNYRDVTHRGKKGNSAKLKATFISVPSWLTSARSDLETAQTIFDSGKNLHHCLFFCHLVLEKGMKAFVARTTQSLPPRIHDLELLAERASLVLTSEMKDFFSLMNSFNLEARYPDERFRIYKKATKRYTEPLLKKTKETFEWINEELKR